jgi:DNA-binding GntR family transcriptional regulator
MSQTRPVGLTIARLSDSAYVRIKRDIVRCALPPGEEVTEAELVQRYDIGKAPVRAALLRLGREGLVRPIARRGHLITPVTGKDVYEMFELRALLEPATARAAAGRIDKAGLRRLEALTRADILTAASYNRANTEFHLAIARAAGNGRMVEALSVLHDENERLFYLQLAPRNFAGGIREHRAIIRALAAGDGPAAEARAATHIERARRDVLRVLHAKADVMTAPITTR